MQIRSGFRNLIPILTVAALGIGPSIPCSVAQPFLFTALNSDISRLSYGSVSLADVNGDGRHDVLYTGNPNSSPPFGPASGIAINRTFESNNPYRMSFDLLPLVSQTWLGKGSWNDVDLDGDLDFLLTGTSSESAPYESTTLLYRSSGAWIAEDVGIAGVHSSVVRWGDYDNDGDSDLLLMGRTSSNEHVVLLYRNDGGQSFVEVPTTFAQLAFGDAAWCDLDQDNDLDLAISGISQSGALRTYVYRNDGEGAFSGEWLVDASVGFSALAWGDYDADGDMDLAISGAVFSALDVFSGDTMLLRNDAGTLHRVADVFTDTFYGGLNWIDDDLDGDLDLFVMGKTTMTGDHNGVIYENTGGSFQARSGLVGTSTSNAEWGDMDGDLDADLVISGLSIGATPVTKIYRNDSRLVNTAPTEPTGLDAQVDGASVVLSWNAASDAESPSSGLTYAVRVGTTPGASDVMSAYADNETGYRIIPGFGNVGSNTSWSLRGLSSGVYYWSVQAIDNSLVGSPFSEEGLFTIVTGVKGTATQSADDLPSRLALHPVFPNPARDRIRLTYDLPRSSHVLIEIYNVLGKRLSVLADREQRAGKHTLAWDGKTKNGGALVSGVYFIRLRSGDRFETQQFVVVK